MTDAAAPLPVPPRPASAADARLRRRYRAERRFRAYGLAAIGFAALFVIVLIGDVIHKAIPAFTTTSIRLDVTLAPEDLDPQGSKDPALIAAGDFNAPLRDALRALFPEVTGRAERRVLSGLLSSGASDALRDRVVADPALMGQMLAYDALSSSNADLYFDGLITGRIETRGEGTATITLDGETVTVTVTTTGADFEPALARIKAALAEEARDLRFEADRVRANAVDSTGDDRIRLDQQIAGIEADAAARQARADAATAPEALDGSVPSTLVAIQGGVVKATEIDGTSIRGTLLLPLEATAPAPPGSWSVITLETPESERKLDDRQIAWLDRLDAQGHIVRAFNTGFFTRGDSREPELAGILGGLVGSLLTMAVTLALSLPLGVLSAIYLEEFAPKNRWTELIEVTINNLAAVPSIVFGLLGLAVFLNFFGMPRSAPVVGGIVIALMVLPTIIIAARAALRAVPPSIREGALGVGASHQQAVFHHVLPLAMPGIMTGTIIGMAHALGETAPLIMIGMVAFIVDVPTGLTEAATVLPVQIFSWADLPEAGFRSRTAAAILVLLGFLFLMNGLAIVLRKRFERRW